MRVLGLDKHARALHRFVRLYIGVKMCCVSFESCGQVCVAYRLLQALYRHLIEPDVGLNRVSQVLYCNKGE